MIQAPSCSLRHGDGFGMVPGSISVNCPEGSQGIPQILNSMSPKLHLDQPALVDGGDALAVTPAFSDFGAIVQQLTLGVPLEPADFTIVLMGP